MDKKAQTFAIIGFIVATLVVVIFLASYLYMHNRLTTVLLGISSVSSSANISYAVQNVFVPVNSAMNSLHWISFVLLFALAFSIILECYYVRRHPILFFFHIIILILAIVSSIYISNYYETLMTSGILSSTLAGFTASSYLILYLPLWVAIIGIIGLIVMSISANRDTEMRNVGLG